MKDNQWIRSSSRWRGPNCYYSNLGEQGARFRIGEAGRGGMGLKVLGKSLSRLETSQSTPPFLQLNFLLSLILRENCLKSFKMLGKAFCGKGFIHLNIAEIHEDSIGG